MKRVVLLLAFAFTLNSVAFSQEVMVKFVPKFGLSDLVRGKKYFSASNNDSVNIETFRFYVSRFSFLKNGKVVYSERSSFHLVDLEKKSQFVMKYRNPDFDMIKFTVGVDSATNFSGAMGGDLDPVNGMYWAWQSGYINFKLEGTSKACSTRNNVFQFHIGGYLPPFQSIQTITLPAKTSNISINVDLEKFLSGIDLKSTNEIMSPGIKAVSLSKLYQTIFTVAE